MRLRALFHFCSRIARNMRCLSFLIDFSMKSQGMRFQSKACPSAPILLTVPSFTVVRILYIAISRDTIWKSAAFLRGHGLLSSPLQRSICFFQTALRPERWSLLALRLLVEQARAHDAYHIPII